MRIARRFAVLLVVVVIAAGLSACKPERTYTYRIATRGPVSADVGQFAQHVGSTLRDPRGWSLGGSIAFRQTTGPADFTIWLSTASQVPSFSSACSSMWSCRVGNDVVINETRWVHASPSWPHDVDSYQHYVVNHEVGHWLGLRHSSCGGGGRDRAPVMAQQSKGGAALGACRFNVWPLHVELRSVAGARGIGVRSTGLPTPDDPFGRLDRVEVIRHRDGRPAQVRMIGWAIDGDTTKPLGLGIIVDGKPVTIAVASSSRPDVAEVHPRYGVNHGYDVTIDVPPTAQTVCVKALGVGSGLNSAVLGCAVVK